MITLPRRSFLLGAATLAAPALIIRTPGMPTKVVGSLLLPEEPKIIVPEFSFAVRFLTALKEGEERRAAEVLNDLFKIERAS